MASCHGRGDDRLPLDRARPRQHASCKDRFWRAGGNGACPGRGSVLRDYPLSPCLCLSAAMFGLPPIQVHARPGSCAMTWVSVIWLCSAGPAQPQCCGDGEDRDLLQQSVAAQADDVAGRQAPAQASQGVQCSSKDLCGCGSDMALTSDQPDTRAQAVPPTTSAPSQDRRVMVAAPALPNSARPFAA